MNWEESSPGLSCEQPPPFCKLAWPPEGMLEMDRTRSESWAPGFLPRHPAVSIIISTVPALVMCLTGGSGKQLDLMFDGGKKVDNTHSTSLRGIGLSRGHREEVKGYPFLAQGALGWL